MARVRHKRHDALVLYPHHRKPFRVRHIASLVITLAVVFACVFELGFIAGNDRGGPTQAPPSTASKSPATSSTSVRSAYGFSLSADDSIFTVSAVEQASGGNDVPVASKDLGADRPLTAVTVKPKPGAVSGLLAATELIVKVNPDPAALNDAKSRYAALSPQQAAAKLFPAQAGSEVTAKTLSSSAATLNGVPVQKTVYEFTDRHSGGKSYAIIWAGVLRGRAFAVEVDGLAGSRDVPGEFASVLNSLDISGGQAVLGADTIFAAPAATPKGQLDPEYLSDALSPAVVQIFHTVCGVLTLDNQALGSSDCVSFSGSGFLATATGYIATNGHVVIYTAKDALANLVVSNDAVLNAYLKGLGLTQAQINATKSDPAALAAMISKIYDLPDSSLHFSQAGELTLVALGSEEPDLNKLVSITTSAQLARFKHDTDSIKQAATVAYNYNPKDSLTLIANPDAGFSSSDVALLKVNVQNAPAIPIEAGPVVQNEKIVVMGFPGDANNPLTDNNVTDVTVTDGVVSSIRQAAGGHGKLYQSDAAASHGNSGGPAIDQSGKAIGLLTYRYTDTQSGDAPESYIRAISDFTDLAANNGVAINSTSTTQQDWEQGLELYSNNHYSAALKDFNKVQAAYPAQRLADSYISSSKDAVAEGKDVQLVPVNAIVAVLVVALAGAGLTVVLIVRHHALHRVYRTSVPDAPNPQPVYMAKPHPAVIAPTAPQPQPVPPQPPPTTTQPPPGQSRQG